MEFFEYKLTDKDKEYCLMHAEKMSAGFSTYSFKHSKSQSTDVYYIGKIGELVFYRFLREFEKEGFLDIKHVPFRDSYAKLNFNDDFIIKIGDETINIEVRTKGRGVPPRVDYECCTDSIKPHFTYVFLSFNKKSDVVHIVGFANWDNFKNGAEAVMKGSKNVNFTNKVNEFNIKIESLSPINDLVSA